MTTLKGYGTIERPFFIFGLSNLPWEMFFFLIFCHKINMMVAIEEREIAGNVCLRTKNYLSGMFSSHWGIDGVKGAWIWQEQ